jgi:hypothetical protein
MPPYIEEIGYKLYALMSELAKKCVIPFCVVLGVIVIILVVFVIINRGKNKS